MSLFSSIQVASGSLQAQQIGLQVVGQNVANANTPGYSRETVNLTPAPTQQIGSILMGLGVDVKGVQQSVDNFLNDRLRQATSDATGSQTQASAYSDLEGVLGDLQNSNLSTDLTTFISSIQDVLNQPQSSSARNLAALNGQTLAGDINNMSQRVTQLRSNTDAQIGGAVQQANTLITQIATLNKQIGQLEGGNTSGSQAVGLRDQRNLALSQLAQLVDIKVQPQPSGAVNVFVGGDYLVFEGQAQTLAVQQQSSQGILTSHVVVANTQAPLQVTSGQIAGLIAARDNVLGNFSANLDQFTKTLSFEFNKIFSSGQGQTGYTSLTSQTPVFDPTASLEAVGLPNTPVSGSFDVQVYNTQTGVTQTTTIPIDLNGLDNNDTTLNSLAQSLNAVSGVSATVSTTGKLTIQTSSPNLQVAFGNDTSGTLAALGLNTFFTGSTAGDLGVNQTILNDPTKFAVSGSGVNGDTANAQKMANFLDQPIASAGGQTILDLHDKLSGDVAQGSATATAVTNGYQSYQQTLQGQQTAISGVNIDEEAVTMMSYQRAYQASAKFISTINQLLDLLVQL